MKEIANGILGKVVKAVALLLAVCMCVGVAPQTTYAASTEKVSVSGTYNYSKAKSVLTEVNKQRSKRGASKLTMDKTLTDEAMKRATELSIYYSHTRPNGSNYTSAYPKLKNAASAENIAAGQKTASAVMTCWMNSSGHRAHILDRNFKSVGIGSFTNNGVTYWVQIFSRNSGTSSSKSGSKSTTASVSVKSSNLSGRLSLSPSSSSINKGKTTSVSVYLKNKGNSNFKSKLNASSLRWSSGSKSVATVSSSGKVTGKGAGSAKITAKTKNGGAKASTTIKVKSTSSSKTSISSCTVSLSQTSYTYNGCAKKPTVTVKKGSTTLKSGTDYSVTYKNNTNVGTASVVVTGKGNYTGSVTKTFTIKKASTSSSSSSSSSTTSSSKPATTSISSLKSSSSGQMYVSWNKISGVSGYSLMYSMSSSFTSSSSYDTKGYEIFTSDSSTSYTFSNLNKGKTYYVKVKTYKTVNGKKTYSDWSSVKSVTIAK